MAFGEHRNKPTIVPLSTAGQILPKSQTNGYIPNSKMARLWSGFEPFLKEKNIPFNSCQLGFAKIFFTGANCLLSGEAGTGKSYLIKALFDYLSLHVSIGKTSPTGVAAFNIGGQTLHSFMGIGFADEDVPDLIIKVNKNFKARSRIKSMEVLFIDEVSMCKGELMDKVDGVLRHFRNPSDPFGGVQLICTGDWLQLPPVFKGEGSIELAFQCASWRSANIQTVVLVEQMRQQGDPTFARVLGDLRVGNTSSLHLLDSRVDAVFPADGIEAVRIFCKNVDVDQYNKDRLAKLTTPSKIYTSYDSGSSYQIESFNKNCPAPQKLELKVGAQVMLLINEDVETGLVNGALGVVKSFELGGVKVQFKTDTLIVERHIWELKEQEAGIDGKLKSKVVATRSQIPLKLCWAVTVHKCQGQTLDRAIVDVAEAFAEGQCYTALSRVRNMESLSIAGCIPDKAIRVNQDCVRFYEQAKRNKDKPAIVKEDFSF